MTESNIMLELELTTEDARILAVMAKGAKCTRQELLLDMLRDRWAIYQDNYYRKALQEGQQMRALRPGQHGLEEWILDS